MLSWHGAECVLYTHKKQTALVGQVQKSIALCLPCTAYQATPPVLTAVVWGLPTGHLLYICCPAKAGLHQHLPSFFAGLT